MSLNSYVVRSGDLRNRITFQRRQNGQDSTGQPIETWVNAFTCWADIDPLTGRELLAAQQIQSTVTHNIQVRYRKELANPIAVTNMRILYGSRIFNIHACMDQDERRRSVALQVEEGLNNG